MEKSNALSNLYHGVFEGGGAKDVAYYGAFRRLRKEGLWFQSVAGASSEAITAALIAADVEYELLKDHTNEILRNVQTGFKDGITRLSHEGGYFPRVKLQKS